jgi:hypothetical protein
MMAFRNPEHFNLVLQTLDKPWCLDRGHVDPTGRRAAIGDDNVVLGQGAGRFVLTAFTGLGNVVTGKREVRRLRAVELILVRVSVVTATFVLDDDQTTFFRTVV